MPSTLFYQLLDSPDVRLIMDRVQSELMAEARRREAFYTWLTPEAKAEFINGEVVMHSPAKHKHLLATGYLSGLMQVYAHVGELGTVLVEKALISLTRNDYEPDICFWRKEVADTFDPETMRYPAPDLVVEVLSKSTEARDRGVKFHDYAAHGVKEYWLVDPELQQIECYTLTNETTFGQAMVLERDQELSSEVLKGFFIPVTAVFERESFKNTLRNINGG